MIWVFIGLGITGIIAFIFLQGHTKGYQKALKEEDARRQIINNKIREINKSIQVRHKEIEKEAIKQLKNDTTLGVSGFLLLFIAFLILPSCYKYVKVPYLIQVQYPTKDEIIYKTAKFKFGEWEKEYFKNKENKNKYTQMEEYFNKLKEVMTYKNIYMLKMRTNIEEHNKKSRM